MKDSAPGTRGSSRVRPELLQFWWDATPGRCDLGCGSIDLRLQIGGDEETRTPDPLLAKEMLYRLSYVPLYWIRWTVVGVSGLEPETSALSGQCSNQLS